jgi:hypothetical protein
MKGPYQIERTQEGRCFTFRLVDVRSKRVVGSAISTSPIAPVELRMMQARLNTRAILDHDTKD